MSKNTVKEFLHRVQRSGLVPKERLRRTLLGLKKRNSGVLPKDAKSLAKHLIRSKQLTRWQCEKLLAGKSRGFFLGNYRLMDHICTGGMSSVYLAEDTDVGELRAVKVFPKSRLGQASYLERFQLEAEATVSLEHPNIVQAYGIERYRETYFLVMEYVRGRDLLVLVNEDGRLDYHSAADYIAQAALGLQYSHDQGVIHRDVKPANLLVNHEQVIKVLDLGLALYTDQESSLTLANEENVLGTADYLAPEQALDSHSVDARADIYGLGCTLYFALTGHPPFQHGSIAQRIMMHQNRTPSPISEERVDCPVELQQICNKMMEKKPERRFQDCNEVAAALRSWIDTGHAVPAIAGARLATAAVGDDSGGGATPDRPTPLSPRPARRALKSPSNDTLSSRDAETIVSKKQPKRAVPGLGEGPTQGVPRPNERRRTAFWLAVVACASASAFALGLLARFLG